MDMDLEDDNNRKVIVLVSSKTEDIRNAILESDPAKPEIQEEIIIKHLKSCYTLNPEGRLSKALNVLHFSFDSQFEWINSASLRTHLKEDALSNFIILDFFTHCCINCIHSIDDLRHVHSGINAQRNLNQNLNETENEENNSSSKFQCGFKVLSIHSPKFTAEKESASIKSSVHRMKMDYTEVINDPGNKLWYKLGIYCWPTIMIFGPNIDPSNPGPNLLFVLFGEGHRNILELFSKVSLNFFDHMISSEEVLLAKSSLHLPPVPDSTDFCGDLRKNIKNLNLTIDENNILNFPGKVTSYKNIVCISDSGNNRIILTTVSGRVKHVIGGKDSGFIDGDFTSTRFYNPQGTAFSSSTVFYVADTGNHCIRKVDLENKRVTSLVQPNTVVGETSLKSPWDITFYGESSKNILLIASAGNHQIFGYFFEAMNLFRTNHEANSLGLIAGSGKEENRNNAYILKSSFAQPSGICCFNNANANANNTDNSNSNNCTIFIADSESSSIRCITADGRVAGVVGGERDPNNLFAFGDQDGASYDVKLQHPISVDSWPQNNSVFIADTYNHKIKFVDITTKKCCSLIGSVAGNAVGAITANNELNSSSNSLALFNEPAGISWNPDHELLFIADTNNHCIKVAQIKQNFVSKFNLQFENDEEKSESEKNRNSRKTGTDDHFTFDIKEGCKKLNLTILVHSIPEKVEGGSWKIFDPSLEIFPTDIATGKIPERVAKEYLRIDAEVPYVPWMKKICVEFTIFLCHDSACLRKTTKLFLKLNAQSDLIDGSGGEGAVGCNDVSDSNLTVDFVPNSNYFLQA